MFNSNLSNKSLVALPIIVFLALAFVEIDLPGLYMDESYLDAFVVKLLDKSKVDRPLYNLPDNILNKTYRYPVTGGIYVGLTATYLSVPYYALFGMNIFSLRMHHVLYGAIIVYLVFLILERIADRRIALWGSLLLAVDSAFLVTYRTQAWNVIAPMPFFLLALYLGLPRGNGEHSITGTRAFFIGFFYVLACFGYFVYILFGPALVLALLLWGRRQLTKKTIAACVAGCFVGYLPFFYALLSICLQGPELIGYYYRRTGSPMTFSAHLAHITDVLRATFNNTYFPKVTAGPHYAPLTDIKIYLWLFFAVCVVMLWKFKGTKRQMAFLGFCLLAIVFFIVESMKFGAQIRVHHVITLLPVSYMALATFVSILLGDSSREGTSADRRWPRVLAFTIIIAGTFLLAPINLLQHFAMTRQLARTGGVDLYSNANIFLAQYLEMYHLDDKIVYCDWGYMLPAHFLTRGAMRFTWDIWDNKPGENKKIPALFADNPRLTFVFSMHPYFLESQGESTEDFRKRVYRAAEDANFSLQGSQLFFQKDGKPVIETFTFAKKP